MNLLEYKKRELETMSNDKNDVSYKYLKWFLDNAIYIKDINKSMSHELGLKAEVKNCYRNSFNNIWKQGLRYVEGYIFSKPCPIPLEHAFLIDDNNMIVDPTMGIPEELKAKQFKKQGIEYIPNKHKSDITQNEYLGIVIDNKTISSIICKRQTYDNNLIELYLKSQA